MMTEREQAKQKGLTRYFTGKPCPRGHVAERMVSTRACVACIGEKKRAWSDANPDKVNAQKRGWRGRNLEHARALNLANQKLHRDSANERNKRYRGRHGDKVRAATSKWMATNPDKVAAKGARYRASKLLQTPAWADHEAIGIVYRAAEVIRASGFDVHVDHIIPLQGRRARGLHVHTNLRIIEANANRIKANRLEI